MRIVFVAIPNSIHTARWINQITDQGWEIHLVPSVPLPLHPYLKDKVRVHEQTEQKMARWRRTAINLLARWPHHRGSGHARRLRERIQAQVPIGGLDQVIRHVRPHLVHSLEFQHGSYPVLETKQRLQAEMPTWIVSSWGSDVYLFHRLAEHRARVQAVLATCDYYACECARDVALARELGLRGEVLPVLSCGGGFDLAQMRTLRRPGPTSQRRVILVKGYQGWAGRGLVALRAVAMCADVLQAHGYRVVVQLASPDTLTAAELVAHSTGLPIEIAQHGDYTEALQRFGAARVHIGLSISDGISQSLLEAMVMGAFPIQSCTACADEWIEDGKSGFIVPPEDPHIVAAALRRAVTDDALVDQAAAINDATAARRLAYGHIKEQVVEMYRSIHAKIAAV